MITDLLAAAAKAVQDSALSGWATTFLGEVPGAPPIVQTVHLLGITAVMGSIVLVDLRVLGLGLRSQPLSDLVRRVMPWLWWALPALALSGLVFVAARPARYFANPVFRIKFMLMVPALLLALLCHRTIARDPQAWESTPARRLIGKAVAAVSLLCWVGVVLAGRWIAYANYLFEE